MTDRGRPAQVDPSAASHRIRSAVLDDAAAIAEIHVRGWQTAYRGLVPDSILDGFSIAARTAWWQTRLAAAPDDGRAWVVETGETAVHAAVVIGFASTGPGRDESAPSPDGAGEIYSIYLAPESRGKSHGRALFAHAVADLSARGYAPLLVWMFADNAPTRRFYAAAGFRADGTRNTIDFDGVPIDEVRYRLDP